MGAKMSILSLRYQYYLYGVEPHHVKVDVRLRNIKPLQANWIFQVNHYLKLSKSIIFWGFKKAHITQPVKEAHSFIKLSFLY